MQKLPQFDRDMAKNQQDAEDAGEVSIFQAPFLVLTYLKSRLGELMGR